MGQVNSNVDSEASGSRTIQQSQEIEYLQQAFKSFKSGGEKGQTQLKISTEVLMNNLTKGGAGHYGYNLKRQMEAIAKRNSSANAKKDGDKAKQPEKTASDSEYAMNNFLRDEEIIQIVYEHVKSRMQMQSPCDLEEFLSETNFQRNTENVPQSSISTLMIQKAMDEVNQDLQMGLKTSQSHMEMLKGFSQTSSTEQANYDKFFYISEDSQSDSRVYNKTVITQQIYVLYSIYLYRQKLADEDKMDFFNYVSKFLGIPKDAMDDPEKVPCPIDVLPGQSMSDARIAMGFDLGLGMSINLMSEIGKYNKKLLVGSLTSLLGTLKQQRPGCLYTATDKMGYQIDQNINEARDFLTAQLDEAIETKASGDMKEVSQVVFQIIMMFGILRSSIEDFLLVLSYLLKNKDIFNFVDISQETLLFSQFFGIMQKNEETKEDLKEKTDQEKDVLKNYKIGQFNQLTNVAIQMLMSSSGSFDLKAAHGDKMISDSECFYIYKLESTKGFNAGIYKLSQSSQVQTTQGAGFRMAGKVIAQNTSQVFLDRKKLDLDSQMVLIDDQIFLKYEEKKVEKDEDKASKLKSKDTANLSKAGSLLSQQSKEAADEQKSSKLMAIDCHSLEPIRSKQGEILTTTLENVPVWTSSWKPYKKQETNFHKMPILTEGNFLYVFGRQKISQSEDQKASNQEQQYSIVINIYEVERDPVNVALPSFNYVKQIVLEKPIKGAQNAFRPWLKEKNQEKFLGLESQWATNGQILLCFHTGKKKVYYFDVSTGKKINKLGCNQGAIQNHWTMIYYNYKTSLFSSLITADISRSGVNNYQSFNFSNFKALDKDECAQLELQAVRTQLAPKKGQLPPSLQNMNIIKNMMKKPKKKSLGVDEPSVKLTVEDQRCLLLDIINHYSTEKFSVFYEEIKNEVQPAQNDILRLFKFKNCTYLTESMFIQLAENLRQMVKIISQADLSSISNQYSLLFLLNLVRCNFKALNHCQIKLSYLLDDEFADLKGDQLSQAQTMLNSAKDDVWTKFDLEKGYRFFMNTYEQTIVAIAGKGTHQEALEKMAASKKKDELCQLWNQIESVCKEIIDDSVSLLHQEPSSMVEILYAGLNKPKKEISLQNACVQISYFNLKDNLKKVIDNPKNIEKLAQLSDLIMKQYSELVLDKYDKAVSMIDTKIFKNDGQPKISKKQSISQQLQALKLDGLLEQNMKGYLLNYCQLVMQKYAESCEAQKEQINKLNKMKQLMKKQEDQTEDQKSDQQPVAEQPPISIEPNHYEDLFIKLVETIYSYLRTHLTKIETILQAQLGQSTKLQISALTSQFGNILKNADIFYEMVFVFNYTFALLKLDSFEMHKNNLTVKLTGLIMEIAKSCSKFQSIKLKKDQGDQENDNEELLKLRYQTSQFMVLIDNLQRQVSWILSQTAFRMIQITKTNDQPLVDQPGNKEKLTEEQKKNLLNIQESSLLSGGIETRHLSAVLSEDRQKHLKTYLMLIDDKHLQQSIDTKCDEPKSEQNEDDKILQGIIREGHDAATDEIVKCLQQCYAKQPQTCFKANVGGANGLKMTRSAFALLIKFSNMLEEFIQMIDHVQVYKEMSTDEGKNINNIITQLKEEMPQFQNILKKWHQASMMRQWINETKNSQMEKYESEVKAELIVKKTKEFEEMQAGIAANIVTMEEEKQEEVKQIDSSTNPPNEEEKKQEENKEEAKEENKEEKKVEIELTYDDKTFIEDEAYNRLDKELNELFDTVQSKSEFLIKLQIPLQYLYEQDSKSSNNCVDSVLSILQARVKIGKIQEQVELIYQNACKRVAGLKIMANLIQLDAPQFIIEDSLNWFCSALRGNRNKIAHYMDDIKGEGTYLENKTRMYFFQILQQIVQRLKESNDKTQIKYFLRNTLEWKFMGRDHQNLLQLGIFQILHKGNGDKNSLLRRCWGKNLLLGRRQNKDEQSISKDVIEYFENLMVSIIARIVDPTTLDPEPQPKKKSNSLSLQKAKSILNENVSETLLVQGFDIIFKEFNRYIKIMNTHFKGIDWTTYVKSRTSDDSHQSLYGEGQSKALLDDAQDPDVLDKNADAETKQKFKVKQQLDQMDMIYHETFLKRLIKVVEIFTNVQASKAIQNSYLEKQKETDPSVNTGLGQYHVNLLVKLSSANHLSTLLNLLVLASPQVKIIILRIIQQLVSVQKISHTIFDQAVEITVGDSSEMKVKDMSEAQYIFYGITPQIADLKESKFLKFIYQYLYNIRHKMWNKSSIESEGAYAVSCELIRTIRYIYEENYDPQNSQNYKWRLLMDMVFEHLFKNFSSFNSSHPIELEIVMSLVRGCDYQGLLPYASAFISDNKSTADSSSSEEVPKVASKSYVQVMGFVQRHWLQRDIESGEREKRVYNVMQNADQKVLVVQFDPNHMQDVTQKVVEPQNLTLLTDLHELAALSAKKERSIIKKSILDLEKPETSEGSSKKKKEKEAKSRQFVLTTEILDTILEESKILNSQKNGNEESDNQDVHQLSQKTMVVKLIHYQLVNNSKEFLKRLKNSKFYQELLRYVCQESSSSDQEDSKQNNITLIDWLEQRCAAIRQHACENVCSLVKHQEVKVQLIKNRLFVQTSTKQNLDSTDVHMTAIELEEASNFTSFEEKKEFKLVKESQVHVEISSGKEGQDDKIEEEAQEQVTETSDVVLVSPENLKTLGDKGLDILNQSKSIITTGIDFEELIALMQQKKKTNPDKYATLEQKTVFVVEKEEYVMIDDILNDRSSKSKHEANAQNNEPRIHGATQFEDNLIDELVFSGGFDRVIAEKIIGKEGSLEAKTLHFSQIIKQLKDGVLKKSDLEEQRALDLENQGDAASNSRRKKKARISQKHFNRPEEKVEILQRLKTNLHNWINRNDGEISIDEYNDRNAYFSKVNVFEGGEGIILEYERILKRLFSMYCRQIFWSFIQNDNIETIFEQILNIKANDDQKQIDSGSSQKKARMRSFCSFIKVIGNECFITNNKVYIQRFKTFLNKMITVCCKKNKQDYKDLIKIVFKEGIIDSYHQHFQSLSGQKDEFRKYIFEYFQSESKAEELMNPIVMIEVLELIIENDVTIIYENFVDTISLIASVSMYFIANSDLKTQFIQLIIRILNLAQKSWNKNEKKITSEQIQQILQLKVLKIYYSEFDRYNSYDMEESTYVKRILRDDPDRKEINGVSRKQYEKLVYKYRETVHQKYFENDVHRQDTTKIMMELAFKMRELSESQEIDSYFYFQNNLMSYFDLYKRYFALLGDKKSEACKLNKYMTFFNTLEQQNRIQSHDVAIQTPEEGCQVTTVEVDFSGEDADDKQLVEKILVRLQDDSEFSSQGAAVLVTSDKDGKNLISLMSKTLFKKDQTLQNVYCKGKKFYVHYPVYPSYNYSFKVFADEPKFELMEKQLYEQIDTFHHNDFGTFYLGGDEKNMHFQQNDLRPYRDHLDIKQVNFGLKTNSMMIFLLQSGQVYGYGQNKSKHFVDQDQRKWFDNEQLIPFYDTKDKIMSIKSYKRVTVAVTENGRVYAVGEKLQKMLKIKNNRFGFYKLPLEDPKEEEEGKAPAQEEEKKDEEAPANQAQKEEEKEEEDLYDNLKAKKVWVTGCKHFANNFIIYCLFENLETGELELYSLGKSQYGQLGLGQGEGKQEALSFKKLEFGIPIEKEKPKEEAKVPEEKPAEEKKVVEEEKKEENKEEKKEEKKDEPEEVKAEGQEQIEAKVEKPAEEEKKEAAVEEKVEEVKKEMIKIDSIEGVDIRFGTTHTFICLNNYKQVFVLGYYDKSAQSQEEILHTPTYLNLCKTFNILKIGTERHRTVVVAEKKENKKIQTLTGQFSPLVKEDTFKQVQFDLDFSAGAPNKVTNVFVRGDYCYVSTSGNFQIDPYEKDDPTIKRGLSAQNLKQTIQSSHQKQGNQAKKSGMVLKLTPDYGFFEHKDFIKKNEAEWEKFEKAIDEQKELFKEEPDSLVEYEKLIQDGVEAWLKEDNLFTEMLAYWKNVKNKDELEESKTRGLKSEKNEKINEQISFECNKYNILLHSTFIGYIWGSLSYLTRSVDQQNAHYLPLFSSFKCTKINISRHILNRMLVLHRGTLAVDEDSTNVAVAINRKKALEYAKNENNVDHKAQHTVFSQVKKNLEHKRLKGLRINSAEKSGWFVKFIGEQSLDDGGLFRECLSEMCNELRSKVLPLLSKSKNQQANDGYDREMFVLNPQANSETHLKMFEFLGALMGFSIRSGILLDLDISRFVWKQITDDEVTIADLELIDVQFANQLKDVVAKSKSLNDEEFATEFAERTMSVQLTNREDTEPTVVDLIENGQNVPLTKARAQKFFDKALEVRLAESKPQVDAIVAGIHKTFDMKFLKIMNWKFLEYRVVGLAEVSTERLKEITNYRNCTESHEVVKRFWSIFDGFTNDERRSYLRFVWARNRLPLKEMQVEKHTFELVESWDTERLPFGRTCYFSLQVPHYETKAAFREKLIYAFTNCTQIDGDFTRNPDNQDDPIEEDNLDEHADSEMSDAPPRRRGGHGSEEDDDSYRGHEEGEEEEEE